MPGDYARGSVPSACPSLRRQAWSRRPQPLKGATPVAGPSPFHGVPRLGRFTRRGSRGFTLIELLVAIGVLALMAGMSWRGLDAMLRTQDQTRQHADALLTLQAGLGQWNADLDALLELPQSPALDWDGRGLRLTRRNTQPAGEGVLVVAWSRRIVNGAGQWLRWQSPPVRTRGELAAAWAQAAQWAQNPGDEERRYEVAVTPLTEWQVYFYRNDAWTNPLSSDTAATSSTTSTSGTTTGTPTGTSSGSQAPPDGIRLVLTLPPGGAVGGRLTRDWLRPTLGGGRSS